MHQQLRILPHPASSASQPERSVRTGILADLSYVIDLQKQWSHNVGFLPAVALKRYLKLAQTLIVMEGGLHAGYLIWTFRPDGLVRLPQVAVAPELLRTTLGTKILRTIIRYARTHYCSVVRLTCRSDLPANQFWPTFDFRPTAIIARPTTRGLPLIEWTLQLTSPTDITAMLTAGGKPCRLNKRPPPTPPSP